MDDLFGLSAPLTDATSAAADSTAYPSRRSLREPLAAASAPLGQPAPISQPVAAGERRAARLKPQASAPSRISRTSGAAVVARRPAPAPGSKGEPRKNPLSVLVTMATVGGMFAVFGLPAYAVTDFGSANTELASASESQNLVVSSVAAGAVTSRDAFGATSVDELNDLRRNAQLAAANAEYLASGAQQLGDDYPWPLGGYGLSPLNYYYRQCTDFVAWRLNRDAATTSAPFRFVWSNLTPGGGDASQWKWAWENNGWTVSSTPVVGAVAWFDGNHVSYVKSVLPGNKVLIEEYNQNYNRAYGQRTLKWDEVAAFLYPPGS